MKKNLLVFLLGLAPLASNAEVISEEQAYDAAALFFQNGQNRLSRSGNLPLKLVWNGLSKQSRSAGKAAPFFVFNRGNNQGFVIVAGDNAVKPILGYAHEGRFSVEGMPENLQGWMNHLNKEINLVRQNRIQPIEEVQQAWSNLMANNETVVYLKTQKWDQDDPYNWKCPTVEGWGDWRAYTGCAITATAIVMSYFQWPDAGVGELPGYHTNGLGIDIPGITLGHPYYWERMPGIDSDNKYSAQEQRDAVSTLMLDLGVMARAKYNYSVTSASPLKVATELPEHMKYHEGLAFIEGKYFTELQWKKILYDELNANRPIHYTGYNDQREGHAFVLDGYDAAGCFSVNWGWGGRNDGFYDLGKLYPGSQGIGGHEGGYSQTPEAIIRFQPMRPNADIIEYEDMLFANYVVGGSDVLPGIRLIESPQSIENGSQLHISVASLVNLSSHEYVGNLKLAVTDEMGNVKSFLYDSPYAISMKPGNVAMAFYNERDKVTVQLTQPIVAGDRIRLVYLSKNGMWKSVISSDSSIPHEIVLKESTSVLPKIEITTTAGTNINNRGVATFSADVPMRPSDSRVKGYFAVPGTDNTIVLKQIVPVSDFLVIPAHTGVVLATDEGAVSFTMESTHESPDLVPQSNCLKPTDSDGKLVENNVNAYILGLKNGNIHFHPLNYSDRFIKANRSYLELPSSMNASSIKMVFDGETTGIEDNFMEEKANAPIFDLSGRQVLYPVKGGIYIQNGKKFIVK